MKRIIFLSALLGVLWSSTAYAQTMISVPLKTASFHWNWEQGTGSMADGFHIKCGPTSGNYTSNSVVGDPAARSVGVQTVVGVAGTYFCAATAFNEFGESPLSNQVDFRAGDAPVGATEFRIVVQ